MKNADIVAKNTLILEEGAFYEENFIWQLKDKVIPVEAKSGENLGSRSLVIYRDKYYPEISVKASMKNVEIHDGLINIPLYLLWNLEGYIKHM